ncbi:DUF805 domain-containing protein [Sabulilitoribacter multivorans]|uniref:DUF805 domain-containing protein n=1 Tax=Flaviramulus multivorans TaxID=1304750 RepID=A0ABS9IL12_9FLAO|nr:DUF805 domain-containing protein [Flaviramulus multivorans]MCF7561270.1 DUF805 domain-containing protein [Flaviramulus multivorans]
MFKNPFSFTGRIRRTEYGLSYLIYLLIYIGGGSIIANLDDSFSILIFFIWIPLLWFLLAQGAKRCHDRGNSGWFQIIPFYGLWMLFGDSDYGANEYGANPKGHGNHEDIDEIGKPIEN